MANSAIKVSSNWSHIGGCSLYQFIQERAADPDFFVKPDLNELVHEEKAILLSKEQSSEYCEFDIKIFPHYKIQAVSFVCNVVKVELFQGRIKEYMDTAYGVVIDEKDELFISYRYDVEIEKSGITDLTLKFLTNSSEVCIFGLILHTAPNPNGITTLLPLNSSFNVQNGLENPTRHPEAVPVKCEELLQLIRKSSLHNYNSLPVDQDMIHKFNTVNDESEGANRKTNDDDTLNNLKSYIDARLKEIEWRINKNLSEMEKRQNQKLDKLLHILEKQEK